MTDSPPPTARSNRRKILIFIVVFDLLLFLGLPALAIAVVASNGAPILTSPGLFSRMSRYLTENEAETGQQTAYPELLPLLLELDADACFKLAEETAGAMGWEILDSSPENRTLHAVAKTRVFSFVDDVRIEIVAPEAEGLSEIRMTSQSRVGKADFGANIGRIVAFRNRIEKLESFGS